MRKERKRDGMVRYEEIRCNRCGKALTLNHGISNEGFLHVEKTWGYGSEQDGLHVQFDLCENCVQELTAGFIITPTVEEVTEWI